MLQGWPAAEPLIQATHTHDTTHDTTAPLCKVSTALRAVEVGQLQLTQLAAALRDFDAKHRPLLKAGDRVIEEVQKARTQVGLWGRATCTA
jgi:hypothetical protein